MSTSNQWLTRRQVAALTGFAPKTLENWGQMRPQKGPRMFKVGNRCLYLASDVHQWMEQSARTAA